VQSYGGRINNKEYKYEFSQTAEDAMAKIPTLAKISDLTPHDEIHYKKQISFSVNVLKLTHDNVELKIFSGAITFGPPLHDPGEGRG